MKSSLSLLWLVFSMGIIDFSFSQTTQESLIGKWKLVSTSGGITGKGFAINEKTIVEFTPDCDYIKYVQDSIQYIKTYHLIKSAPEYGRKDSADVVHIGKGALTKYKFSVQQNSLILRELYADGFVRVYVREFTEVSPK